MNEELPIVAVVGRPNVGKSTLFNSLLGSRQAIVEDEPGITRDRNYAVVERYSIPFILVDTGGFESGATDTFSPLVLEQTKAAIAEADAVIAVFDGRSGIHPEDEELVRMLRKSGKTVRFVVNKCDGKEHASRIFEFYQLGADDIQPISALNSLGTRDLIEQTLRGLPAYEALLARASQSRELKEDEDLTDDAELEEIIEKFRSEEPEEVPLEIEQNVSPRFAPVFVPGENEDESRYLKSEARRKDSRSRSYIHSDGKPAQAYGNLALVEEPESTEEAKLSEYPRSIRVALVGRPNVGKSSLLNSLAGESRAITSEIPGTTRDSLDMPVNIQSQEYVFVDTAGIRRKSRVTDQIERYSVLRALRSLRQCDVAVVLIDATQAISEQDVRVAGAAHELGRGLVIVINKWDLVEKEANTAEKVEESVRDQFKFAPYAPIVFISAKTGRRVERLVETVREIARARRERIPTSKLNRLLKEATQTHPAPVYHGEPIKLLYAVQVEDSPPRILLFFNTTRNIHFSYLRYLKNAIRAKYPFEGSDIVLTPRKHE